ncbi:TRAP transporter small permease subunit [Nocardia rhamnosiphila]
MSAAEAAVQADASSGERLEPRGRPHWVRWIDGATLALLIPAGAAVIFMVLQIIIDVAGRTLFNTPVRGTMEMTSDWWMVAMVFLALAYAQSRNEHIRATMITEMLPAIWQRAAEIATVLLLGMLALAMVYFGWTAAMDSYAVREASSNVRSIPLWPFRFLVPLGCVGLAVQCVGTIYEIVTVPHRTSHAEEAF